MAPHHHNLLVISLLVLTLCSTLLGFHFQLPKFGMVSAPNRRVPNAPVPAPVNIPLPIPPIPLPAGLFHGQTSNSHLKLVGMKKCPAVVSNMPSFFEIDFLKCSKEVAASRAPSAKHPDQDKRANDMIVDFGYDLKTYDNVHTDDGYLLTVFRITGGKKSATRTGKPAVLLHHGMVTSSDSFLLQHSDRNLAFKLADAGYDVWLPNFRGTTYSQGHAAYSPADEEYWDFSFHEIGVYDLPSVVRLMLHETGNEDVFFIGHSMGGTSYAIGLSERPELNKKIRAGILLAPAIFIGHSFNPLRSFTSVVGTPIQNWIYNAFEGYFDAGNPHWSGFLGWSPADFCTNSAARCGVCDNLAFFLYGFDAPQANFTNLPNIIAKIKNVASFRTVIHFAQNLISCDFRHYDYGYYGNYHRYGRLKPPRYHLERITTPTYIFYGDGDNFVPPIDIQMIKDAMNPEAVKELIKVEWPFFNHIDFVTANDADLLVYDRVVEILNANS